MKEVKFTRQELYELVWKESMLSLSKIYAISDVGLRKKCRALEIPFPNTGYWAKLKYGKTVIGKIPLESFSGQQNVILYLREQDDEKSINGQVTHTTLQKEIENDLRVNLNVPERLVNPDKLIESVKDDLYKKELWNKTDDIAYSTGNQLDIRVNPKNIARALRIMDTLIKAFKTRGHSVKIENGKSYLVIEGEQITFCLRERLKRIVEKGNAYDYTKNIPSGVLVFRIEASYNAKEWADGKHPLEEQLSTIMASLELKAKRMKEERIEDEKRRAEQKEKERIAKELQDRKDKELKNFKELFKLARRHDRAENIRNYADKLETFAIDKGNLTNEMNERLEWIRKKADWYDPFIEAQDELMADVDRDKLAYKKRSWWG